MRYKVPDMKRKLGKGIDIYQFDKNNNLSKIFPTKKDCLFTMKIGSCTLDKYINTGILYKGYY